MARVFCVGHAVQDYVFMMDRMPAAATKHRAHGFVSTGGGPAATAAVAIARLGGAAMLAARVGDDAVADAIIDELQSEGVDCANVRRFAGRSSSLSAVMIDAEGERMIVNYQDRDIPDGADWLPERLPQGVGAVLGDTRWPAGAAAMFAKARAAGVPAVLDADASYDDAAPFALASHIAFSAEGLAHFTGADDLSAGLKAAKEKTGAWCCVTDGARGAFIDAGYGERHVPAFEVEVVDTLGAGDVWHGAFALALGEGEDELAAARFAAAAAALKVARAGGRKGAPHRAEVEEFLRIQSGSRA